MLRSCSGIVNGMTHEVLGNVLLFYDYLVDQGGDEGLRAWSEYQEYVSMENLKKVELLAILGVKPRFGTSSQLLKIYVVSHRCSTLKRR